MIFQSDISELTGLDHPRVSRSVTALGLSPVVAARGPRPGKYTVGDAAKFLVFAELRAAGVLEVDAARAVRRIDDDTWSEIALHDKPLWLVVAGGKVQVLDAESTIEVLAAEPSAITVNLRRALTAVLKIAAERAESPV